MAIDRVELIMQAVECNKVQAMIYEDEIKDIPDSRLMDFFKFRLQFLDRYDDISRQNLQAYKLYLIENNSPKTVAISFNFILNTLIKPQGLRLTIWLWEILHDLWILIQSNQSRQIRFLEVS